MKIEKWEKYGIAMGIAKDHMARIPKNMLREIVRESQNYDRLRFVVLWKARKTGKYTMREWLKWLREHIYLERLSRAILGRSM